MRGATRRGGASIQPHPSVRVVPGDSGLVRTNIPVKKKCGAIPCSPNFFRRQEKLVRREHVLPSRVNKNIKQPPSDHPFECTSNSRIQIIVTRYPGISHRCAVENSGTEPPSSSSLFFPLLIARLRVA